MILFEAAAWKHDGIWIRSKLLLVFLSHNGNQLASNHPAIEEKDLWRLLVQREIFMRLIFSDYTNMDFKTITLCSMKISSSSILFSGDDSYMFHFCKSARLDLESNLM